MAERSIDGKTSGAKVEVPVNRTGKVVVTAIKLERPSPCHSGLSRIGKPCGAGDSQIIPVRGAVIRRRTISLIHVPNSHRGFSLGAVIQPTSSINLIAFGVGNKTGLIQVGDLGGGEGGVHDAEVRKSSICS